MRRVTALVALFVTVMLGFVALASSSFAQDATPPAGIIPEPVHPIVGTWIINDPSGSPSVTSFTADGVVIDVEASGGSGLGVWHPTGERTADFTMILLVSDQQFAASIQINASVTIDASGNSGTAAYTYTAVLADGTVAETGKGDVTVTRMSVQPLDAVGTPIAGFPVWNPAAENATPEASPTS